MKFLLSVQEVGKIKEPWMNIPLISRISLMENSGESFIDPNPVQYMCLVATTASIKRDLLYIKYLLLYISLH